MPVRLLLALILLAAAFTAAPSHAQPPAATYFISPVGDDANSGTAAAPFQTVAHARDAVRAISRTMTADIVVELAAGTYTLAEPLVFTAQDSGANGHRIVYRAAPGARVILSGGRKITGWTRDATGRFTAPCAIPNFRQLYVNGRRATRARGPVPAGLEPWGKLEATLKLDPGQTADAVHQIGTLESFAEAGYRSPDPTLAGWKNPSDIEFGYYNSWTHMVCPVDAITRDGDGCIIKLRQPGYFLACRKPGVQAGAPAYIENALELLDEPGEWYLDRPAKTLYYLPLPGEDMATAEVIAPELQTLVHMAGTLDAPVHDIAFEGLTFAYATWLRPSEFGHPDVQACYTEPLTNILQRPEAEQGYAAVNGEFLRSPANVVVDAGRGIRFDSCTFTALGAAGLDLQNGSQDNVVNGCRFEDISANGIQIGDVRTADHHPTDPRNIVRGNQITNSLVTRTGAEFTGSVGIICGYTDGTVIAHNEIANLPYSGVSVGWGWGEPDAGGGGYYSPVVFDTPTTSGNNRIEYNHIHNVMLQRTDGGGIYTLSRQPGTIIRGNYIHDNGPGFPGGIYLDEGSADIEVTGNVVAAVGRTMNYNNYAQNRIASCKEHDNFFTSLRLTDGIVGQALHGPGSSLEVPHSPDLDTPQLTVEAWIRLREFPSNWDPRRWAVCKAAHEFTDTNYSLCIDKSEVLAYLNIGGGQGNCWDAESKDSPLKLDTWQEIAFTYAGDTLRSYCDGIEKAAKRIGKPRTLGTSPLTLGARLDRYSFFDGDVDEVRIYSRALSAEELVANVAAVPKGTAGEVVKGGLAGYWSFDDIKPDDSRQDAVIRAAGLEPAYRTLLDQQSPAP